MNKSNCINSNVIIDVLRRRGRSALTGDASRDAARDALAPTVAALQESAQQLVRDMCAVGRGATLGASA